MRRALFWVELRRARRDPVLLFFVVVLPVATYLGFGAVMPMDQLPGVDVDLLRAGLMIGLSAYGAATAASTITGQAAVERLQGWGRQLALTPVGYGGYALAKTAVATVVSCLPILLTFTAGAMTGVRIPLSAWLLSAAVLVVGSVTWACYGLAVGLAGRTQSTLAIASGGLVLFSFVGGVYLPLGGLLLDIGRWTPLYGYVTLARWPVTGGRSALLDEPAESLWVALASASAWTMVLAGLTWWALLRSRERR